MLKVVKLTLILIFAQLIRAYDNKWPFHEWLDPHGTYLLRWRTDDESETITFMAEVRTRGWIGFGISPNGGMKNSDIVIGWMTDGGNTYFSVMNYQNKLNVILYYNYISLFRIASQVANHFLRLIKVKTGNYCNLHKTQLILY